MTTPSRTGTGGRRERGALDVEGRRVDDAAASEEKVPVHVLGTAGILDQNPRRARFQVRDRDVVM